MDELSRRQVLIGAGALSGVVLGALGSPTVSAGGRERPDDLGAEVPTAWFDVARTLVQSTPGFSPPVAARAFGYTGIALYESVVAGSRRHRSLAKELSGLHRLPRRDGDLHWPTVANSALGSILRSLFPTTSDANKAAIDSLESSFADRFRRRSSRSTHRDSIEHGWEVAWAVFDWSRRDGGHEGYLRNFRSEYMPPVGPGLWVPSPPAFQPALQPFWGANRCFAIVDGANCSPGGHTPYSEDPQSQFFAEALEVYDAVNNLDAEREAIARFWADEPGATATPPGHSVSIATQVLRAEDASLMTAAETYAKVGIAVSDAFVACWNTKFRYNLLRPVTYVQRLIDPAWLPLLTTPPFPEYTSGRSVQSGAAFGVLADLFGDDYTFDDHTHDSRGLTPRHFDSFSEAADEAALSRLYGGIHYRPAIELGLQQGRCVADAVNRLPVGQGRRCRSQFQVSRCVAEMVGGGGWTAWSSMTSS